MGVPRHRAIAQRGPGGRRPEPGRRGGRGQLAVALRRRATETTFAAAPSVVSCLGHTVSLRGVLGPPPDLVDEGHRHRLCRAVEAARPASPVKLVLMSSVSVHQPGKPRRASWPLREGVPLDAPADCFPRPGTTSGPPTSCAGPSGRAIRSCSGWWFAPIRSSRETPPATPCTRGWSTASSPPAAPPWPMSRKLHVRAGDGPGVPGRSGSGRMPVIVDDRHDPLPAAAIAR